VKCEPRPDYRLADKIASGQLDGLRKDVETAARSGDWSKVLPSVGWRGAIVGLTYLATTAFAPEVCYPSDPRSPAGPCNC